MKKILFITAMVLTAVLGRAACNTETINLPTQVSDTLKVGQVHSVIQNIFYNLPLEKSRLALREVLLNDKRFTSTDTTFNNFNPLSFFKGNSTDKGLIESNPDSIQVMLIYGNAALVTEKGGQEDTTKHPMILEYKYFFSDQDSVEKEYRRLLKMVHPIYTDKSSISEDKWEADFSESSEKCIGKIFDHYDPYYRVAISYISVVPSDGSKPIFVLDVAFSKEDK
jgi:hypothetical protein